MENRFSKIQRTITIAVDISSFRIDNVFFLNKKRNKIFTGKFSNIIYSNNDTTFNGIYLNVDILYGKINNNSMQELIQIERDILKYYKIFNNCNKNEVYSLKDSSSDILSKAQFILNRSFNSSNYKKTFILKISGIWETENQIGITLSSTIS